MLHIWTSVWVLHTQNAGQNLLYSHFLQVFDAKMMKNKVKMSILKIIPK